MPPTAKKTATPRKPSVPRPSGNHVASEALAEKLKIKTAKAWRPEPGDMITGTTVAVLRRSGGKYADYPMLVLEVDGDYVAVHAMHGVLLNQLKEIRPTKGTELTILYSGKVASKNTTADGKSINYHNYAVVTPDGDENADAFGWDDEPDF